MLYGLMIFFYVLVSLLLGLIILIQRGKGGSGLNIFGNSSQVLFGGSGGQDILQKTTWVLGALFLTLSLTISLSRSYGVRKMRYINESVSTAQQAPVHSIPLAESNESQQDI